MKNLTETELLDLNYQEMWDFMLTQPNYILENGEMYCNGECEHLALCFMCS